MGTKDVCHYETPRWSGNIDDRIEGGRETAIVRIEQPPSSHPGQYQVWVDGRNVGYAATQTEAAEIIKRHAK